jgi:hypothetical protein
MRKTRSEVIFERWLDANMLAWRPVSTGSAKTPDYAVTVAPDGEVIFEIKQIETDRNWHDEVVHGGEVGALVRERINRSKAQIKASSRDGKPTVLIIFNDYDPLQLSGTEDHDFFHAMYGAYTVQIDIESRAITERFLGKGKSFQSGKNTSFSAIGRLMETGREATVSVTIFENIHAAVPINYDALPPCFEVVRCPAK